LILLAAVVLGLVLVPATGGSFHTLRNVELRAYPLLPIAVGLQVMPTTALQATDIAQEELLAVVCWIAGAILVGVVSLRNWHLHGMRLIALGVACNALVILLNMGMPVGIDALKVLGDLEGAVRFLGASPLYQLQSEATRVLLLADILPLPGPPTIRAVVSLGDLLLFSGVLASISQAGSTPYRG